MTTPNDRSKPLSHRRFSKTAVLVCWGVLAVWVVLMVASAIWLSRDVDLRKPVVIGGIGFTFLTLWGALLWRQQGPRRDNSR